MFRPRAVRDHDLLAHGAGFQVNPGEQETPEEQVPSSYGTPPPPPIGPPGPIQWNLLFRLASPLAIITGVVTFLFWPIGLLLVVPVSLKRIIARYRPLHSGVLQTSQGVLIGVFTAVLSFVAYSVFTLPTLSLNRASVLAILRNIAAQSPYPRAQQMSEWFATNEGFIAFRIMFLVFFLALFLIAGALSGAWITRTRKAG
ncbi:MAG TPA: hypothetical protein VJW20_11645 [Candidatus Angelobacter sp.]|nr:hypothetical protein [Candidatus Angelobacter sp.]